MTVLILFGNPNQFTFANTLIAANDKAISEFNQPLEQIFVLHSEVSHDILTNKAKDWRAYVEENSNIDLRILVEATIPITPDKDTFQKLAQYIEIILKGVGDSQPIMVDFTNGLSLQKNLLAIITYILDLQHQYMIDITQLIALTDSREFLPLDILSQVYISVPDSKLLDDIAYLSLSEMTRYKQIIAQHTNQYAAIDHRQTDATFFQSNFEHSIQFKLKGDQNADNAIYRISTSSIAVNLEEIVTLMITKYLPNHTNQQLGTKTFGQKLQILESRIIEIAPPKFDVEFFRKFNSLILQLRNSSTHKAHTITHLEKFKAQLSLSMAFSFIDFYTDIVSNLLSTNEDMNESNDQKQNTQKDSQQLYYGLDGDNTGAFMEDLFVSSQDENELRRKSRAIKEAIEKICKFIRQKAGKRAVIFEAGDDCMFKGHFTGEELAAIQQIYYENCGLTCSIGIGRTFQEVYIALKLAKAQPGKHNITKFMNLESGRRREDD